MLVHIVKSKLKSIRWLTNFVDKYRDIRIYQQAENYIQSESKWKKMQEDNLRDLLDYARGHSRYYRNLIPLHLPEDDTVYEVLRNIPLLSKDIIRNRQTEIFSDEVSPETPWANTGGSTGEPLRFPAISSGKQLETLCQAILYIKMGGKATDLIVAVDGTRIDEANQKKNIYWKEERTNFPYGKYAMSTLCMSHITLPYYVSFLNRVKPSILRGYPSGVIEIARYCDEKNIIFDFQLKGIYLTSENYGFEEEQLISKVFKCPVFGQYGHTEASIFAIKKPSELEYSCLPIYGVTEILSPEGIHVKKGETGEVVVTGFNHYGIPFIRYKTGDYAVYGGETENGFVILKSLLGRSIDYLINDDGERIFLVGFIFGGHLKAFNYIAKWQLEQKEVGKVYMRIVKGQGFDDNIEKEIVDLFIKKKIVVEINYVDEIKRTMRGKCKFMIQHLS